MVNTTMSFEFLFWMNFTNTRITYQFQQSLNQRSKILSYLEHVIASITTNGSKSLFAHKIATVTKTHARNKCWWRNLILCALKFKIPTSFVYAVVKFQNKSDKLQDFKISPKNQIHFKHTKTYRLPFLCKIYVVPL
jgi:hypothetical protein